MIKRYTFSLTDKQICVLLGGLALGEQWEESVSEAYGHRGTESQKRRRNKEKIFLIRAKIADQIRKQL